jgi:deoxyribodipyrimidine photo-lyase
MICPSTRTAALGQLGAFLPIAGLYARDRNQVKIGHSAVTRLSPAIRHRLVTEDEVVRELLGAYPFSRVEKLIQEVYWRRYWKSWLALRPEVWADYLKDLAEAGSDSAVARIEKAQSGNAVIDHFVNELVSTGYLHNHARMWFAAWWVHEARLPWQAGAAFFYRHLLDGDPASNTLSWRWVAGLQTPGKTYLARRSNLEKYLDPTLLASLAEGLDAFENPRARVPAAFSKAPITPPSWPLVEATPPPATGLWIHEEDLCVETSLLGLQTYPAVIVTADTSTWDHSQFPMVKRKWISAALQDAATRAAQHWHTPPTLEIQQPYIEALVRWATANRLGFITALRPDVGPLNDSLSALQSALDQAGVGLILHERSEDAQLRPLASGGFFSFWERLQKKLMLAPGGKSLPSTQQLWMDLSH